MNEADMYMDSANSSLEYVPGIEYEDFGSCSIGSFTMGQFDGAVEDDDTDDDASSDEGGEPEKNPEASYSSTDSDDIIYMVVEAATENIYEKCSGSGEHSNCWPHECIITTSTDQVTPRDNLIRQGATNYDEELIKALKLSVREEHQRQELQNAETKEIKEALELSVREKHKSQELQNAETKEMERALELSLLEMTKSETHDANKPLEIAIMNSDEKKQLEIAIMASLEDISDRAEQWRSQSRPR